MNITISLPYKEEKLTSTFSFQDQEIFSKMSWEELYRNVQHHCLPFYVVACAITHVNELPRLQCYDGISLYKFSKKSMLDPLTHLKIEQIRYIFFKCHQFTHTADDMLTLPLNLAQTPSWSYQHYLSELVDDAIYSDVFFDSLTIIGSETKRESLAKRQWIIGSKLLNNDHVKDGLRWIWCAAENQLMIAQREVGMRALKCSEKNPLYPNIEQAEKWLALAAKQGDQIAQQMLNDLKTEDSDEDDAGNSNAISQPSSSTSD